MLDVAELAQCGKIRYRNKGARHKAERRDNMKEQYLNLLGDFNKLSDWVDSLSHEQRIELRKELEKSGCSKLSRNLYYDYEKQCWI